MAVFIECSNIRLSIKEILIRLKECSLQHMSFHDLPSDRPHRARSFVEACPHTPSEQFSPEPESEKGTI